jgi:hypothetical protein
VSALYFIRKYASIHVYTYKILTLTLTLFKWRLPGGDKSKLDDMVKEVKTYDAKKLSSVGKAFSHFLSLSNSAENHHRMRRLREWMYENKSTAGLSTKNDSVLGTIRRLVSTHQMTADQILEALNKQSVEIVLTAHPTEVNRRTMLRKHQVRVGVKVGVRVRVRVRLVNIFRLLRNHNVKDSKILILTLNTNPNLCYPAHLEYLNRLYILTEDQGCFGAAG